MAINNHLSTIKNRKKLDSLLLSRDSAGDDSRFSEAIGYAQAIANVENVIAVVSDMSKGRSRIIAGGFASMLGLEDYIHEDSIWENRIFSMMSQEEQELKIIAELRFFHFLRHVPKMKRSDFCLIGKLRFCLPGGKRVNVLHRMYYIYDDEKENVLYAICLYGPLPFDFTGKSLIVNMLTGTTEELTSSTNNTVLSKRECQVLSLIDEGLTSVEIAERLIISRHTVNRHRQEILAKLQVKNSIEACRLAKSMELI